MAAADQRSDWAALPRDIVLDVFLKLGPREVMLGAEFTCKPWRDAAVEEPSLWRRVGMDPWVPFDKLSRRVPRRLEMAMKEVAVDRAKGQCEAFSGDSYDDYLLDIVPRAPCLKRLRIQHSGDETLSSCRNFIEALSKLTLLEDLEIVFTYSIDWEDDECYPHVNMFQSICQACPHLEKLILMFTSASFLECNEDESYKEPIDVEIPLMRKLHTLELYDCDINCRGLKGIVDNCPCLENLHIDGYFNDEREMDKDLRMKCARVKNLNLDTRKEPHDDYFGGYSSEGDYDSEDE
ncbi:unnamed protein product [Urochloa decumbens]|uniref:F-box domain-containing protein n=1 Tax=Urochloa decumbens TaxID=240449 RepID=A0ABC9BUH6_9POAL